MENNDELFGDYITDTTIKGRVKNPKTWVNLLILIVIIAMAIVLIQSIRDGWSKEEIKNSIKILDFDSKWVIKNIDFIGKGSISSGNLKKEVSIVPAISFRIKNTGKRNLGYVRFIGNFVYAEKRDNSIGDGYFDILKDGQLKPGEISAPITIKSTYGYKTTTRSNENYEDMFFNKKGWKKFNVRISARVKGTFKEIAEFPVSNKIDEELKSVTKVLNEQDKTSQDWEKNLRIEAQRTEWIHMKNKEGDLFVPTVTFKLQNTSTTELEGLRVNVLFELDDRKEVVTQWKGKKNFKVDRIELNGLSESLYFEAENGIRAGSVEEMFKNNEGWSNTFVKIYIGSIKKEPVLFKKLKILQKVKGYRLRSRSVQ